MNRPTSAPRPRWHQIDWLSSLPFFLMHLAALGILITGFSWVAAGVALLLYLVRMFGITAGYHRYFAHRSYRTSRLGQSVLAWLGTSAMQKGPLWWAGHHRHHHKHSDDDADLHSPRRQGLFWSHVGWFLSDRHDAAPLDRIRDFAKYPELRWLDRYHLLAPGLLAIACTALGAWLQNNQTFGLATAYPSLAVTTSQMLVIGFCLSTVCLWHGTFVINSLAHVLGRRRYATGDDSKNSLLLALITLGEGWHNNHHFYQASERQGFFWWEIDISHYCLKALACCGLVWDLKGPSPKVLALGPAGHGRNRLSNEGDEDKHHTDTMTILPQALDQSA